MHGHLDPLFYFRINPIASAPVQKIKLDEIVTQIQKPIVTLLRINALAKYRAPRSPISLPNK